MQGLLLDSDYMRWRDPPCMRLFVKSGGETITIKDPSFKHYFYVLTDDPDRLCGAIEKVEGDRRGKMVKPESTEVVERNRLGESKKVVKVTVKNPLDISPLQDEITDLPKVDEIFEYDLSPSRRYLIDHELTPMSGVEFEGEFTNDGKTEMIVTKPPKPGDDVDEDVKIMGFDIETYCKEGNPDAEEDPIIMISLVDGAGFRKVITWRDFESDEDYVEVVDDERSMLRRFLHWVEERDPDIVTGYNTDLFDFPYIEERFDQHGLDFKIGRDGSETVSHRRRVKTVTRVPGRPHVDIYTMVDFLSRIGAIRLINYTLENVYKHMLDREKPDLDHEKIPEAWDKGGVEGRKLLEYSLSDSQAVLDLAEEIIPLVVEISRTAKQSLFDVSRMTSGQLVEWLLIYNSHQINELVPPRPGGSKYMERKGESYVGGYVKEPEKGLHENLVVLDFRSLYPTIIVTHNIDPSTLDCDCCGSEERVSPPNLDYEFCQRKRGFIPEILEELITARTKLKEGMKGLDEGDMKYQSLNNRQWALKILANSFYGMLGYPRARWYSKECAESVTSFGRYYIKQTISKAQEEGFEVVYGDTDSLLCKIGEKNREEIYDFLDMINEEMPGMMELEIEGFYKRGVFITKKRYAMAKEDGKMEVKGLEFVRRDWAALAKRTQEEVLRAILQEGSPEKAADFVQKVTKRVKEGEVDLEDLTIHTRLKKSIEEYKSEGPHVAAAKRLRKEGREIEPGMSIAYIVEKGGGNVGDRAIPVSQFEDRDYDPDYYIGHQILPAVLRVMEVLGYGEEALRYEETRQTRLGTF